MKNLSFPFVIFLLLLSSCVNESALKLDWQMSDEHDHLGYGFWVKHLYGFKKAKSYEGFQAPGYESSISITKEYQSLDILLEKYGSSFESASGIKLLERREVFIDEQSVGHFIKFQDSRRRITITRYRLLIEQDGKVYQIKAFYPKLLKEKYEETVSESLLSITHGKEEEKEAEMKFAGISNDTKGIIYTRDGALPTESEDAFTVEAFPIQPPSPDDIEDLLAEHLQELLGEEGKMDRNYAKIGMRDGIIYSKTGHSETQRAFVRIIRDDKQNATVLLKAYGNSKLDIKEAKAIVGRLFLEIKFD